LITAHDDGIVRLWDLEDLEGLAKQNLASFTLLGADKPLQWGRAIQSVAVSTDSRWLVAGSSDTKAYLWDLSKLGGADNPEPVKPDKILDDHQMPVRVVAISPQGRWLVTGSQDGTVCLWELTQKGASKKHLVWDPMKWGIRTIAISTEEDKGTHEKKDKWLIVGTDDGTACLWDLKDLDKQIKNLDKQTSLKEPNPNKNKLAPKFTWHGHKQEVEGGAIRAMALSPDGHWLVTGSNDTTACLWNLTNLNPAIEPRPIKILRDHKMAIRAVAISPKGQWLVTASEDKTARLWDLEAILKPKAGMESGAVVLEGHEGTIQAVAISPGDHWLVTGSGDSTARVWNLRLNELEVMARRLVGRNLTYQEWDEYFFQNSPIARPMMNYQFQM